MEVQFPALDIFTWRLIQIDNGIGERKDANPVHMEVWARVLHQGFERYFAVYGNQQVHLWLLTTHPDFRRRGAGTMLCNWGLEKATEKHWMLTVVGSQMGRSLYEHLGYGLVGTLKIQADGEEEILYEYCLEKKTTGSDALPLGMSLMAGFFRFFQHA